MQQLEIRYFFPLTEQIALDLDFTPSTNYLEEKRKATVLSGTTLTIGNGDWGSITTTNATIAANVYSFRPDPESAGYWQVNDSVRYYVKTEPKWLVKKMTKLLLGWKWGKN